MTHPEPDERALRADDDYLNTLPAQRDELAGMFLDWRATHRGTAAGRRAREGRVILWVLLAWAAVLTATVLVVIL